MTTEELARKYINEAVARLQIKWATDAMTFPLTEAGDVARRANATKSQMAKELAVEIELSFQRT